MLFIRCFVLQADRKRQADMKKAQLAKEAQLEEGEYEAAVRSDEFTNCCVDNNLNLAEKHISEKLFNTSRRHPIDREFSGFSIWLLALPVSAYVGRVKFNITRAPEMEELRISCQATHARCVFELKPHACVIDCTC